jgi:hypothetical protein
MAPDHTAVTLVLVGAVALISLALAVLGRRAQVRSGNPKLGYVAAAFAVFCLKSLVTVYALLKDPGQAGASTASSGFVLGHGHLELLNSALDLVIVFLLFVPFLRR